MTKRSKMAVIGNYDSALAFRSVGAEVFPADNGIEAGRHLKSLKADGSYAVVFVTERLAAEMTEILNECKADAYPVVIPIPDGGTSNGFSIAGLKKDVEKAVGIDILFNT